jgi:glycosyltransferase involved in cell wall biosynthesis
LKENRIIVMFAYHFPPENAIGGARPFRFYKYLSRNGYRCHVITAAIQPTQPNIDVEYVADPFITQPRQGVGWQLERAIRKFLLPGVAGIRWSRLACQAARTFVRSNPNAEMTVFSTYPPLGTHLAAFQLTRKNKLAWIADFRDPLGDNPTHNFLKKFQQKLSCWLERTIIKAATVVIANTDTIAEKWRNAYPDRRESIHLIWNGFDPEDRIQPLQLPVREYTLISHIGALYQGRNITSLLESVSRLIEAGRLASGRVRIQLIGSMLGESLPGIEFLERAKRKGWLELISNQIPRREALAIAQTSDGLLLVQPHSSVQVPGKLFEYLQIGRPVLAFILPDTPIERILRHSGVPYRCVYAGSSAQEMDDAVEEFFKLKTDPVPANAWFEQSFDARRQTQALETLIRSIH